MQTTCIHFLLHQGGHRVALGILFLLMLAVPSLVAAQMPGNDGGLFVVEDALAQFDALKHHAEALAWRNPEHLGAPDPSTSDHYQGLARNPRPGAPVFYVSQLDDDDGGTAGGYLHVVRFASRTTTGERLRSNLQQIGNDTEEASPPGEDTWVRSIRFDGTPEFDGVLLPTYKHPGSMALVDDVLFVPVDQPTSGTAPTGHLLLFDVAVDPTHPIPLQALPLPHSIDNVAVTRNDDGTYRLWTNGNGGSAINVYDTTHADLRDDALALTLVQAWVPSTGLVGAGWPTGIGAHQSSTFLREPDGALYLIGMRHTLIPTPVGSDVADLYRVDEPVTGRLVLTHLRTREFHCVYDGGGGPIDMRVCNMAASNNAYVSPTGELILYSIPHDDEDGFSVDIVRVGEFRHRDVNREDSPLRQPVAMALGPYAVAEGGTVTLIGSGSPAADRPWVELYDDDHWGDRSIVVDYDDRLLYELNNFNDLDDFGDKTSSLRWRLPVGLDVELFDDHDFSDRRIILRGTGSTEIVANLDTQVVVPGVIEHPGRDAGVEVDFGDKTSSLRFIGVPPDDSVNLTWDLDDDGNFGETGTAAGHGDEAGGTVTFATDDLDGPGQLLVSLRVTSSNGSTDDVAAIDIVNIAPTASFTNTSGDIIEREEAILAFTNQQDPSLADELAGFLYAYDCTNDGQFEIDASPVAESTCYFPVAGTVTARGRITDKDGGYSEYTTLITVLSPREAIIRLVDTVEGLNLHQGIDNALDAKLQAALQALDDLDDNDFAAAINTLQAFINHVEAQRNKKLTSEQADILVAAAQRIINSLAAA
jgi:hypothetical protein